GEDSSKAIIVSSHLDHVGAIGDNIWRGAFDNASGVASTLNIAEYLKENFKSPQYDIVFIFFNGEETNLLGSNYLIPNITKDYDEMLNINIDCIGMKESDTVLVTSNNEEFKSETINYFTSQNINAEGEKNPIGDGGTFDVNGIPAISLIDKGYEGNIHILDDTSEKLSFSRIEEISKACGQFIIEQGNKILENLYKGDINVSVDVNLEESLSNKDLNQWEYKFVQTGDYLTPVVKTSLYMDKRSFETEKKYLSEELLNKLNLKFELNPYTVSNNIFFDFFNEVTNPEAGKVYSITPTVDNFTALESSFLNLNNEQLPRSFNGKLFKFSKTVESDVNSYNAFLEDPLNMDYGNRSKSLEKIDINGKEAQILYAASAETQPIGIVFFIEGEKNFYTIYICDDEFNSSFLKDKEELINLVNSIEVLSWYEEIINNLEG
ncbi:MAG: M20/M25/M40 family metallo-hydrolase, partial [Clostridium sp.]